MKDKKIVLWGATGQARMLRECLSHSNVTIVALFDNDTNVKSPFDDIPIYYTKKGFKSWIITAPDNLGCLVAIGGQRGKERIEIQEYLSQYGINPIIAIHPTAFVANDVRLGAGTQVLPNSSVCTGSVIGKACIINTGAIVEHECRLHDGVHISSGATLTGLVEICKYTMVGANATILPRLSIGENCIIGAGSVVTKNIPSNSIAYGNPARVRKINGDKA